MCYQTMSSIATFFIAISLNPHVQSKAQEELDRVLGCGRLPGFGDRTSLPYIEAIYREVMRWHPAIPLGKYAV
jgi:cytochrome P450